jgi:hypothetical protein
MRTPFKMKGAGEVYYEGSGDPINLNPKDLIKLKGNEKYDEHGNEQWMHKETQDIFYKNKPRKGSILEDTPVVPTSRPIEDKTYLA